ncbi:MAG: exodeoxyribonuclease III [Candidatus Gracilibacteria bacterium]|nr:exodeoxyribonuclease III [Candidatus Gracilibacteria bacterium]
MKAVSWNVNGVRSVLTKGFLEYLATENPDIIGLQEVKATEEQFPAAFDLQSMGYHIYWNPAERKGYSGTAVFTKVEPLSVRYGLGMEEHDQEGRIITLEFEEYFFVTVYTPNAKSELERLEYRQLWDSLFFDYLKRLEVEKSVIVCGDLNVAHQEIDLTNPKPNRGSAGFTDEERAGFGHYLANGFIDTFRHFYPDKTGEYTWWSNFFKSRDRNIGWRIDYFLISESLENRLQSAFIRQEIRGSDHCPVGIEIET